MTTEKDFIRKGAKLYVLDIKFDSGLTISHPFATRQEAVDYIEQRKKIHDKDTILSTWLTEYEWNGSDREDTLPF